MQRCVKNEATLGLFPLEDWSLACGMGGWVWFPERVIGGDTNDLAASSSNGRFQKQGYPKMDGLKGKTILELMIWGYHYFWKKKHISHFGVQIC